MLGIETSGIENAQEMHSEKKHKANRHVEKVTSIAKSTIFHPSYLTLLSENTSRCLLSSGNNG